MPLPFTDQCVLLTGAGGSIGGALARTISQQQPRALVLLDHSEGNLHQLNCELGRTPGIGAYSTILGDIADEALLAEIFEKEKPGIVLHAAAYKQVPMLESNVVAAVRNNALGTNQLAKMAAVCGVATFVMVSTDKAVHPGSVMGATKRVAELALLRWTHAESPMRAVRLGNVWGSQGSVVPTFLQQIAAGGPVTVTHAEASRFFFSMEATLELILLTVSLASEPGIYIPHPRDPVRILDLAKQLIRDGGKGREIPIVITGLRPGDNLSEQFTSQQETIYSGTTAKLRRVCTPEASHGDFDAAMEALAACVESRDVTRLLQELCRLVPEYRPSETALASHNRQETGSR